MLTEIIKAIKHDAQIIVQPEPENIASVQVLLANGYRYDPAKGYYFKK